MRSIRHVVSGSPRLFALLTGVIKQWGGLTKLFFLVHIFDLIPHGVITQEQERGLESWEELLRHWRGVQNGMKSPIIIIILLTIGPGNYRKKNMS